MTHEEQNIGGGAEHPGSDERKISQMLSGLKRVEAPKDFDFHLKARIAKGRPEEVRPASLFPILKYALPLALVLFVSAGLLLKSSYDQGVDPNVVAGPAPVSEPIPAPQPSVFADSRQTVSGNSLDTTTADASKPDAPGPKVSERDGVVVPPSSSDRQTDRSKLFTGGDPDQVRLPKGFEVNSNTRKLSNQAMPSKSESIRETLRPMGVEFDADGNSLKVRSVSSGSIAGEMGLQQGDLIEAIDGKSVDASTVYNGKFTLKTMKIRRDGTSIDLTMRTQP